VPATARGDLRAASVRAGVSKVTSGTPAGAHARMRARSRTGPADSDPMDSDPMDSDPGARTKVTAGRRWQRPRKGRR
jgi:hypothetical protein